VVNILKNARHCSVLYICNYGTLCIEVTVLEHAYNIKIFTILYNKAVLWIRIGFKTEKEPAFCRSGSRETNLYRTMQTGSWSDKKLLNPDPIRIRDPGTDPCGYGSTTLQ